MCGVAGLLGDVADAALSIRKMCDIIRHRGPDDVGYAGFRRGALEAVVFGDKDTPEAVYEARLPYSPGGPIGGHAMAPTHLVLGHRRLSIVELSALGHQPMCSADGRYWISFNGEIYNHVELRAELQAKGHKFISRSDTEVILAAYAEWGEQCLAHFNGMWGLAILDRQRRTVFLARDRFGIKPLYYWVSPSGFLAFASEIKQFTVLPGWKARVNGQRAYDFLVWSPSDHTDETLFDRVYQLRPGSSAMLAIDDWKHVVGQDGRIALNCWYALKAEGFSGDFRSSVDEFRRRLSDAVRLQLRADVSVGYALSGGIDSSAIVCIANRMLRQQGSNAASETFSMCADGHAFNERQWIDVVVAAVSANARYVSPSGQGLFDALPAMTWHQDEPFGSPAVYGQWCVFREASAASIKVLLGGHGSDEPLAGYPPFYTPIFGALARKGRFITIAREALALQKLHGVGLTFAPRLLLHSLLPAPLVRSLKRVLGRDTSQLPWLDLKRLGATARDPFLSARARGNQAVFELSRNLLTLSPSPMMLHYEDRNSMAHSFESRVPFLDHRLVEFALGLPDEFKLHRGVHKRVLREAMVGILPDATRGRMDKIGMGTPNESWLTHNGAAVLRAQLDQAIDAAQGVLTPQCRDYIDAVTSGKRPFDQVLWRMLSFGAWAKTFDVAVSHN